MPNKNKAANLAVELDKQDRPRSLSAAEARTLAAGQDALPGFDKIPAPAASPAKANKVQTCPLFEAGAFGGSNGN